MAFHYPQSALKDLFQSYMDTTRNPGLSLMENKVLDPCIYVFKDVLANVYGHIENTQKYSEVSSISQNGILCFPKGPT